MAFPWPATDPSSIAKLFEAGAGPESLIAAASAWALEGGMYELSAALSSINIASLLPNFVGVGGTASAATGEILNILSGTMGGHCLKQQAIVLLAIEAYLATRAGLIPSVVVDANRVECAHDVAINPLTLGALTPRIAELNGEYVSFWAQNAGLGTSYGTTLNALTAQLLVPPPAAAMGANPAAPALMAGSVAESAATNTATAAVRATTEAATSTMQSAGTGGLEQLVSGITQGLSSVVQPITGMFGAVPQVLQGLVSLPQSALGSLTGMFGNLKPTDAALAAMPGMDTARTAPGAIATAGAGGGGIPGGTGIGTPGLTTYTRPTGSFEPEGGRPTGLRSGLLNATEVRNATTTPAGGAAMPLSPATGMLNRGQSGEGRQEVQHARIVIDGDAGDQRQ